MIKTGKDLKRLTILLLKFQCCIAFTCYYWLATSRNRILWFLPQVVHKTKLWGYHVGPFARKIFVFQVASLGKFWYCCCICFVISKPTWFLSNKVCNSHFFFHIQHFKAHIFNFGQNLEYICKTINKERLQQTSKIIKY